MTREVDPDKRTTEPTAPVARAVSIVIELSDDAADRTGVVEFFRECALLLERPGIRRLTIIAE